MNTNQQLSMTRTGQPDGGVAGALTIQSSDTKHVLSLSYGKDSMASIYVVKEVLGWPLNRIVTADVWATDTIPADPPPMVEFKGEADDTIKKRWGIEVEHFCARDKNGEKVTYEKLFYHIPKRKTSPENAGGGLPSAAGTNQRMAQRMDAVVQRASQNASLATDQKFTGSRWSKGAGARGSKSTSFIRGFPMLRGNWCTSDLKRQVFQRPPCTRGTEKYCAIHRDSCG